jgi:DNA-binding transcriptional LysR family regulator
MSLRQLEYLLALSHERHFARAAEVCSVSQPTLSEGIRKLEEELDVPLIRRGRKFEGLTAEGERTVIWAQRILSDRDSLKAEVDAMRSGLAGTLRIGSIPTASTAVSLVTGPFCATHPLASVQVISGLRSDDLLAQLLNFEIDAGLTYHDQHIPDVFHVVPLYREKYMLLTGRAHKGAGPTTATWKEAAALPLCLLTPTMQGRRVIDEAFTQASAHPAPLIETDSVASLIAHVRMGRWASVIPCAWLHVFGVPESMRAVPLIDPVRAEPIGLVTLASQPQSVMARALSEATATLDLTFLERFPADGQS